MAEETRERWEQELIDGLIGAGEINAQMTGGEDDRRKAMENIAEPICEAIKNGAVNLHFVGSYSVAQLNALKTKENDGIYGVTDNGVLANPDGSTLQVTAGSSVMWDGSLWHKFLDIDLSDYYTKAETEAVATTIATASATAAVATEASEREAGDMALDLRINTKEDVSNKSQSVDDSSTSYPSGAAVKVYVAEETAEIIETLEDETTARQVADELLQGQIDELSQTQTDWDEEDSSSLSYLKNHPQPISALDIEALFS